MATAEATAPITLPDRSEVDPKDCWDLTSLYASEDGFEADFAEVDAKLPDLEAFKGRLADGAAVVRAYLDLETAIHRTLDRLYNYAARRSDENTQNSRYMGLKERCVGLVSRSQEATSFFRSELTGLDQATLDSYLAAEELEAYRVRLERVVRFKPYTLSEREERILALSSEVTRAPSDVFGQLTNADLRFGFVTDERGRKVEVTHGSYSSFLAKRDRAVRKTFFETYYKAFDDHKHTLAATLAAGIKRNVFYARARGFDSARQAALFENDVPESVYDNLVGAVNQNLEPLYRYYELRRRLLDLDEVRFYDIFVPVVPDLEVNHAYDEGVDRVIAALGPLGEEYRRVLAKGLKGGWVDRYENRGKRSGAYSSGCYDSDPFILLNYRHDSLDHVYTLAHEAGHSMHSWFANHTQPPQYADYSIFVAEVASTFNEALLTHHLLDTTTDPRMRAYIINREIDDMRGTLFRQVMFAEFERDLHRMAEDKKPLSLDNVTGLYHDILERYYGPRFKLDACLDLECLRIPHFYYNFYVFQYATGLSAAVALSDRVLGGVPGAVEAYLGFLKAGGSGFPIDILKRAGVDMTTPEPVEKALALFARRVDELGRLMDEIAPASGGPAA